MWLIYRAAYIWRRHTGSWSAHTRCYVVCVVLPNKPNLSYFSEATLQPHTIESITHAGWTRRAFITTKPFLLLALQKHRHIYQHILFTTFHPSLKSCEVARADTRSSICIHFLVIDDMGAILTTMQYGTSTSLHSIARFRLALWSACNNALEQCAVYMGDNRATMLTYASSVYEEDDQMTWWC